MDFVTIDLILGENSYYHANHKQNKMVSFVTENKSSYFYQVSYKRVCKIIMPHILKHACLFWLYRQNEEKNKAIVQKTLGRKFRLGALFDAK